MTFLSREDAGRKLARHLQKSKVEADVVLGLPRGGVVVAAEVARALHLPLDVIVVRKIGHPRHREFAVGALAEAGVVLLDQEAIGSTQVVERELEEIIAEEQERLRQYQLKFERHTPVALTGKRVCLVDDGLATGATTEAAVLSVRKRAASKVIVAIPVASTSGIDRLQRIADEVIALWVDPAFDALGRYYEQFNQTTDEEVIQLLERERPRP